MNVSPLFITIAADAEFEYQLNRDSAFDFGEKTNGETDRHACQLK
jgi:hypothetical protein